MITDDGCDAIDFLSTDTPDLPNWEELAGAWMGKEGDVEDIHRANYRAGREVVQAAYAKARRTGYHEDVLGRSICEAIDTAYVTHISPFISHFGNEGYGSAPNTGYGDLVHAITQTGFAQIKASITQLYSAEGLEGEADGIIAQMANKIQWIFNKARGPNQGLSFGPTPLLSPKYLGDIVDHLASIQPAIAYVGFFVLFYIQDAV